MKDWRIYQDRSRLRQGGMLVAPDIPIRKRFWTQRGAEACLVAVVSYDNAFLRREGEAPLHLYVAKEPRIDDEDGGRRGD